MTGVFDSGAGGLTVLGEIVKAVPSEDIVYFADSANCPYGTKSPEFVLERSREITRNLLGRGARAIVIACNTATAASIQTLRREFPSVPFVGMEPAVKPAALGTKSGIIGILATAGTLKAAKYLDAKGRFTSGIKVIESVGEGFVELVERMELEGPQAERTVESSLLPLLESGADKIVLGCTHYPFLSAVLEKVSREWTEKKAGRSVPEFINPAPAAAMQLSRLLEGGSGESGKIELYSSGDNLDLLQKLLGLTLSCPR